LCSSFMLRRKRKGRSKEKAYSSLRLDFKGGHPTLCTFNELPEKKSEMTLGRRKRSPKRKLVKIVERGGVSNPKFGAGPLERDESLKKGLKRPVVRPRSGPKKEGTTTNNTVSWVRQD